jgi:glutathione synthase/RimK-type ligase-like ATP-grasp enzyme
MSDDQAVLVVSTIADMATDVVVRCLADSGVPCLRVNTENYPFADTLTHESGCGAQSPSIKFNGEPLAMPRSIWYRRMRTPSKPEGMDAGVYDFCLQETRAALLGSILSLSSRWMSHPRDIWQAENKPFQLRAASAVGLCIPRTIITNEPKAIRQAYADFGQMIVKPTRTGYVIREGKEYSIFTSRVLEEHLDQLECARYSPSIYQEMIPKKFDLRITIVGRKIFAAAIDSQSEPEAVVDWRHTADPNLPHHAIVLPAQIENQLMKLMDSLGLTFGAIDMIETPAGDYVFLEVNPSGQWLWLDDILSLGISRALAEWLAGRALS